MIPTPNKAGISILGVVILGIILVFALNYYHISIQVVVNPSSNENQSNQAQNLWTDYIQKPIQTIWNEFLLPYFWNPFLNALKDFKDGNWNMGTVGQQPFRDLTQPTSQ